MLSVGIRDSGHEAPIIKAFIGLHRGISRATGGGTNVRSALLQHRSLHLLGTDHSVVCLSAPHRASFISAPDRTVSTFCQLCLTFSTHSPSSDLSFTWGPSVLPRGKLTYFLSKCPQT